MYVHGIIFNAASCLVCFILWIRLEGMLDHAVDMPPPPHTHNIYVHCTYTLRVCVTYQGAGLSVILHNRGLQARGGVRGMETEPRCVTNLYHGNTAWGVD